MAICGIDLGTTNSLIAVLEGTTARLIPNALGETLTPSAVSLLEDGSILSGRAARDRLITHPERSAASFKRLMGTAQLTRLGAAQYRPEDLSAFVLKALKDDAAHHLGETIDEVVISVPAYFNDIQRKATIDAARLAGLSVRRLVNEPTAAALAYGLDRAEEAKFLVFDLGGGTFDVSILDKYEGVMEVRATTGDARLGGDDFTASLEELMAAACRVDATALSPAERARLRNAAEVMKHDLSREHEARFALVLGSREASGTIRRDAFEAAVAPLLRRLRTPIERAVSDARLDPAEIDQVIMVGGATRMPMVRSLVARLFGRMPLTGIDPDKVVARGAAVQAGLAARSAALEDTVVTDVSPFTLGVAAQSQGDSRSLTVVPLIERNAMVPISRTKPFTTVSDGQKLIRVPVYQGENLRPEGNVLVGEITIDVPPRKAGEEGIDVRFTYDVNGALEVEVTALTTGETRSAIFRNSTGLSETELKARFAALAEIKLHPRDQLPNRVLIARAERLYQDHLGEAREAVAELLMRFERDVAVEMGREVERIRRDFALALDRFERSPLLQTFE
jgi:molecular chaperone HscC